MLPNKFHANQASSYCHLISSSCPQSLVASAIKLIQACSDWTRRAATRRDIIMLIGCISTETSNAGIFN